MPCKDRNGHPGSGTAELCGPQDLDVLVTSAPVHAAARSSPQEAGGEVAAAGEVQA
ncbi:hypothetical protein ACF081_26105 [Streptomyces longwoodensis]|uniref:hypothetical protein n=1 Tax=Streptomyces longwoodensis TaxID=68231 RepID=UPI0036FC82E6